MRSTGFFSNPKPEEIVTPLWGDDAAQFRWELGSLPGPNNEAMGADDETVTVGLLSRAVGEHREVDPEQVLVTIARNPRGRGLADVVDLLWEMAARNVGEDEQAVALADLAVRAGEYAARNPPPGPAWLHTVQNDTELMQELRDHVVPQQLGPQQAMGAAETWDAISEAFGRITSAAPRLGSTLALAAHRARLSEWALRFLGDAMSYLTQRGTPDAPGTIPKKVLADLRAASEAGRAKGEKLVVVAHSMGGNIMYDLLSAFLVKEHKGLHVDLLVTVGSQVAAFEELKLFHASDPQFPRDIKKDRVAKPAALGAWLNVFDTTDPFAFATKRVFSETQDVAYSTGKGFALSHGSYFALPSFHQRLRARLKELLL